jgi:hypothetical protein
MTATDERTASAQGNAAAMEVITDAYSRGMSLDAIERRAGDNAAGMLSDAQTTSGQAFARSYDDAARDLVAELRDDERQPGEIRACDMDPGTAHPDAALAAKGWHSNGRVFVRQPQAVVDRYREIQVMPDREAGA